MPAPPYQDWLRYPVPSADGIGGENLPVVVSHIGPILDCSSWSHLVVSFNNAETTVYYQCYLNWSGFVPINLFTNNTYFVVGPGDLSNMAIPTRGRTVQIAISSLVGTPAFSFDYGIVGSSHPISKYDARVSSGNLLMFTKNMIAGEQDNVRMSYWYEGPVSVAAWADNTTGAWVAFQSFDIFTSAYETFAIVPINSIPNDNTEYVYFPATPVRALINNTGAGQNVNVNVYPVPITSA